MSRENLFRPIRISVLTADERNIFCICRRKYAFIINARVGSVRIARERAHISSLVTLTDSPPNTAIPSLPRNREF